MHYYCTETEKRTHVAIPRPNRTKDTSFDLEQFHLKGKGRIWRYHWMKTLRSISLRYVDRQYIE